MSQEDETFATQAAREAVSERNKNRSAEELEASGVSGDAHSGSPGVLKNLTTASESEMETLMHGNMLDEEQALDVCAAIEESERYGSETISIFRWVRAQCGIASQHKSVREWGIQGVTHYDQTVVSDAGKKGILNRGKSEERTPQ